MDYSYYAGTRGQPFSVYAGLPTPDQQPQTTQSEDAFAGSFPLDQYNQNFSFDPSFRLDPSAPFIPPQPHSPPDSLTKQSASSPDGTHNLQTDPTSLDGDDSQIADPAAGRSSSEEKESLTPAQSKRKAQNRAAQRAFRERKERRVHDLEEKVSALEQESSTLQVDNERLKRELAKYATENDILRATSQSLHGGSGSANQRSEPTVTGPMNYSPTDFYSQLMPDGAGAGASATYSPLHRITECQVTGEKLLGAGATWDLIQSHELFKSGQVDVADVTERLKGLAQCDGQGPAFREGEVHRIIEESAAAGQDELI